MRNENVHGSAGVDVLTVPFPIATYRSNAVRSRAGDDQASRVVNDLQLMLGGPDSYTARLLELLELEDRALAQLAVSVVDPAQVSGRMIAPAAWAVVQQMLTTDAYLLPDRALRG